MAAVTSGVISSSPGTDKALAITKIIGCVHCEFLLMFKILLLLVLEYDLHLLLEVSILISESPFELLLCELSPLVYGGLLVIMLLYHELVILLIPLPLLLLELL